MKTSILDDVIANKYNFDLDMLKIILESIPANVFFKDTECRYQMVSHLCNQLNCGDKDWSILGKTDLEVQNDPELAKFYYEDDRNILKTGEGNHYVSEMEFDGYKYYYEITKEPIIDSTGNMLGIIGIVNDISEFKRFQEELRIISITDRLTGVYNRNYFEQRMLEFPKNAYGSLSVIMCDTNGLKFLNDNFGHHTGDALLRVTVSILNDVIGDSGEIMRIGGDEFIVISENCSEEKCWELVSVIKEKEKEKEWTSFSIPISNAYGYATIVEKEIELNTLIADAEKMMYKDKANVKEGYLQKLEKLLR